MEPWSQPRSLVLGRPLSRIHFLVPLTPHSTVPFPSVTCGDSYVFSMHPFVCFHTNSIWLQYLFIIFFEVELIYNIVLVSGVQQSDSVTHTYAHTYYSFSGSLPR